ncbi:hypothetical protein CHS0354_031361 [Potamilus streckersoni]|uniref:Caspase family p20 domain-containing protein n=1 Tax=Potamilus streckersoni TaxID=2493646 RepID=A0AAE0SJQ5_9BIVA|nr:hypothetical protein CHS0354_031361 [Potamilus streckersoni]
MEKGQLNLDEASYEEYLLKSDGNLSEENSMNETKANTCDLKITKRPFILTTRRNYDISSDVNGNGQIKVFEPHELNEGNVPEESGNNYNSVFGDCYNKDNVTAEHKHDAGLVSGENNNATAVDEHEQDAGVVSINNDNATAVEEHEQDAGVVSINNDNATAVEEHEQDAGLVSEDNDNATAIEEHEQDAGLVSEDNDNATAVEEHEQDAGLVSEDNDNATAVEEHEQDAGLVSEDNDNATAVEEHKHDAGLVLGENNNATAVEEHEQDAGVVSEDNDNATAVEEHEQDAGVVSINNDNATAVEEHEQDAGVVSINNDNATAVEEHEQDDSVVSGDDGNDKFAEDNEHHDCLLYGDDDNDTVAEEHDSVNTHFVTDEEDIAFSIKNLFSCIEGKEKKKHKNPYKKLTNDKEKQPLIEPFRQTQSRLLKMTHEHVIIPNHPPIKTLNRYEVHNSDISGASFDTLVQSEQTNPGNIHTGNVDVENSCRKGHLVNNWDVAHNCIDPDQYDFTHPHRGYAVLIVNQHFSRLDARHGANVDVQNTMMVLRKLGFFIKNKQFFDLDKQSALAVLRDAKDSDHSRMDSFAFIISSHGNELESPSSGKIEHVIYFSDDQYIFTNDILKMFSDENCPSLKEKPKLFFIQACRGTKTDSGIKLTVDGRKLIQERSNVHHTGHSLHRK